MTSINYMLLEFIFIIIYIDCQVLDDRNGMKVFACMNVMDRKFGNQNQPNVFSPIMLSCYLKITDAQIEQVLHDFGAGVPSNSLDQDEIDELANVENLKSFPEDELKKKSAELETIIEEFKKFDKDFSKLKESKNMENDDNDNDNDNKFDPKNFKYGTVKKGKRRQIKFDNGIWVVIICSGFMFFMLFISWITSSPEDKNNDDKKEEKGKEKGKEKENNKDDKEKKENEKPKKE